MSKFINRPRFVNQSWKLEGLCLDMDPEFFFPINNGGSNKAQKVCRSCPVVENCLKEALKNDDVWNGVRGGLSPRKRRTLRDLSKGSHK